MKAKLICLSVLYLFAQTTFAQEDAPSPGDDGVTGRPSFEWTSGNFFNLHMLGLSFSPLEVAAVFEVDYWSGYHHLSFPLSSRAEIYIGFAWALSTSSAKWG